MTVALFWTVLIRATRDPSGEMAHGSSFGILDRGARLLTAVTGSCVVSLYVSLLPADVESASVEVRARALQQIDSMRWCRYQELEFPGSFPRRRRVRQGLAIAHLESKTKNAIVSRTGQTDRNDLCLSAPQTIAINVAAA